MKYINLFETQAAYDAAAKYYPNVSYIEATDEVVYQENDPGPDYSKEYLTFEALESGTFTLAGEDVRYSLDGGDTWTLLAANTATPTLNQGDKILWKGQFDCNGKKFSSTCRFNAMGNIMSLMYGDNFIGQTTFPNNFTFYQGGFYQNTRLVSAENLVLPATTLIASCYRQMFDGCTSLTTAPTLPATTLANDCYMRMFSGCTSLTTAPTLPSTTIARSCYTQMFWNCTSLTTAPALPSTTLADYCYQTMFMNCTSLTTAPALPATTLTAECYSNMFRGCTSLTTAPELNATTLTSGCYTQLFHSCTNLNSITMLATDISASECLKNWVDGVQTTSGTFTKAASMTTLPTGNSGIPANWTVVDIN